MNKQNESYELGQDITSIARAKQRKETSVVSVRLTGSEIAKLDALSHQEGKSVSQIIKDAITAYSPGRPSVVLGTWSGGRVVFGDDDELMTGNIARIYTAAVEIESTGTAVPIAPFTR